MLNPILTGAVLPTSRAPPGGGAGSFERGTGCVDVVDDDEACAAALRAAALDAISFSIFFISLRCRSSLVGPPFIAFWCDTHKSVRIALLCAGSEFVLNSDSIGPELSVTVLVDTQISPCIALCFDTKEPVRRMLVQKICPESL